HRPPRGADHRRPARAAGGRDARGGVAFHGHAWPARRVQRPTESFMIPFLDLGLLHRPLETEFVEAARRVIRSGQFVLGPETTAFEGAFANFCGVEHAIAVSTGTSALHLALRAVGVGPGDEVITTPSTFVATVAAIQYANAKPRFVDIDPDTWTIDPAKLEAAITPKTKAILPVHLHGRL